MMLTLLGAGLCRSAPRLLPHLQTGPVPSGGCLRAVAWSGRPLLPSRGASQGPADPYKVLGVTPQTEDRELKAKFFKLARECHPDLHPNDPKANARFAELTVAYESIKDAEARSSLKWKRMMSDDSSQQDSKRGPRADEEEESDSDFDSDYDEEDQPVKEKPTKKYRSQQSSHQSHQSQQQAGRKNDRYWERRGRPSQQQQQQQEQQEEEEDWEEDGVWERKPGKPREPLTYGRMASDVGVLRDMAAVYFGTVRRDGEELLRIYRRRATLSEEDPEVTRGLFLMERHVPRLLKLAVRVGLLTVLYTFLPTIFKLYLSFHLMLFAFRLTFKGPLRVWRRLFRKFKKPFKL